MHNAAKGKHAGISRTKQRIRTAPLWQKVLSCSMAVVLVVGLAPHFGGVTVAQADSADTPPASDIPATADTSNAGTGTETGDTGTDGVSTGTATGDAAADANASTGATSNNDPDAGTTLGASSDTPTAADATKAGSDASSDDSAKDSGATRGETKAVGDSAITITSKAVDGKQGRMVGGRYLANGAVTVNVEVTNVESVDEVSVSVDNSSASVGTPTLEGGTYTNTVSVPAINGLECTVSVSANGSPDPDSQTVAIDTEAPKAPEATVDPAALDMASDPLYFDLDSKPLSIKATSSDTDIDTSTSNIQATGAVSKKAQWSASGSAFEASIELGASDFVSGEETKNANVDVTLVDEAGNKKTYVLVAQSDAFKFVDQEGATPVKLTSETALFPEDIIKVEGEKSTQEETSYAGKATVTVDDTAAVFDGATVTATKDGTEFETSSPLVIEESGTYVIKVAVVTDNKTPKTYEKTVKVLPASELTVDAESTDTTLNGAKVFKDKRTVTYILKSPINVQADKPETTITENGASASVSTIWTGSRTYTGKAAIAPSEGEGAATFKDLTFAWNHEFAFENEAVKSQVLAEEFIVDAQAPSVSVEWNEAAKTTIRGKDYYTEKRIATITIEDETAISEDTKNAITSKDSYDGATSVELISEQSVTAGEAYTKLVVEVAYDGTGDCSFAVPTVSDIVGHTVDVSGFKQTFSMLVNPVLTVQKIEKMDNVEKILESGTYFKTDNNRHPLKVTFSLQAASLDQAQELSIAALGSKEIKNWSGSALNYTAEVTYYDTGGLLEDAIVVSSETCEFYAPGIEGLTKSYVFVPNKFAVDGTPPTLDVEWSEAATAASNWRWYQSAADVKFTVKEVNPLEENDIVIDYGDETSVDLSSLEQAEAYTLTKTYSENGFYSVTVDNGKGRAAHDLVGLEMIGDDVNRGKYSVMIIVNNEEPKLTVTIDGNEVDNGSELYYDKNVKIRAEVKATSYGTVDNFDVENSTFDGENGWVKGKDNTYYIEKTLTAESGSVETYKPDIHVQSKSKMATDFNNTVVIDKVAPKLTVSFDSKEISSENKAAAGEVLYYDDTVVATVAVEDAYIDTKDLTVTADGDATIGEWDKSNPEKPTIQVTLPVKEKDEAKYALSVTGKDMAGNPIESGDESSTFVKDGSYATTVVIDQKAPVLTVTWDNNNVLNGKYYNAERTPTITIEETYFDPTKIVIDGTSTKASDWEGEGTYTYKNPTTYKDSEGKDCNLIIEGADRSGNLLEGQDNATPPVEAVDGKYDSGNFIIDTVAPVVTISLSQARTGQFGGTDYYRLGNQLQVTTSVDDKNFDPKADKANTSVLTPAGTYDAAYSVNNWSDNGSYLFTFGPNSDKGKAESNSLSATVYDLAGNSTTYAYGTAENEKVGKTVDANGTISGNAKFALDIAAPTIDPGNAKNIPSQDPSKNYSDTLLFYKTPTKLAIIVNDTLGIESVGGAGSDYSFDTHGNTAGDKSWTLNVTLVNGKEFTKEFVVTATDLAKNVRKWRINPKTGEVDDISTTDKTNTPLYDASKDLYPIALILDTTAPIVSLSGATAGQYYNNDVDIVTAVTELNFGYLQQYDGGQVITTMNKEEGNAGRAASSQTVSASAFIGGGSNYSSSMHLSADGHYTFRAHVTDPAGNEGSDEIGEFTIDQTAPTIEVSWDNNNVRNGKYYNAGRTATVVITEHNFDPSQFTITTTGSVGGWSTSGDTHTAIVSFATDGTYTMTVSGQDKAGNVLPTYEEPEFVVDLTAPRITFSQVEEYTAYNDVIAPVIIYEDEANFDSNGMTYNLVGSKNGARTFPAGESVSGNTGTVSYVDIERIVENDDIYTLSAHLTDLAGNEADNSIVFSVNRFGSNFIIVDEEKYTEHNGYMADAPEVLVREINVSGAESEKHGVSVTHGLATENLKLQTSGTPTSENFYIESGKESYGWSTYLYHIGSGNFKEDGNYHVVISSVDTATNLNNSASYYDPEKHDVADAEVSFVLDNADPLIEGVSVSNGQLVDANKTKVAFTVTDNIGYEQDAVKVTLDGEEASLTEENGQFTVDAPAKSWTKRNMQISATDYAGRTAIVDVDGFNFTTDFLELNLPLVIGAVIVILGVGAGALVLRNRRKDEGEQQ